MPDDPQYQERLKKEFQLIEHFDFVGHILRVRQILDLAEGIPYLTRGSAGASLICYLLKISNIDPIRHNIPLARFMHYGREDYPDIDIDFPSHLRDELYERIYQKWPGKFARISNEVTHGTKSALREAIRETGYRKAFSRFLTPEDILPFDEAMEVRRRAAELEGEFKHYSLHCGGIVHFEKGVPKKLKIGANQVGLTKDDVARLGLVKIDLLCNRGLSQLMDIDPKLQPHQYPETDKATSKLFCEGDNIGLTFAESPTCRNAFLAIQPQNVYEVGLALAVVRPMAGGAHKSDVLQHWNKTRDVSQKLVYEDDAITLIQKELNCDEEEADRYRKGYKREDFRITQEFENKCKNQHLIGQLRRLKKYGFCKAHAISYGRLVWALAYQKAHNPKRFWQATLNNCNSYYRPWVHMREASAYWKISPGRRPWYSDDSGNKLLSENDKPKLFTAPEEEYLEKNWWSDPNFLSNMYQKKGNQEIFFRGLIACGKEHWRGDRFVTYLTIGTDNGEYLDLYFSGRVNYEPYDWIMGSGITYTSFNAKAVKVHAYRFGQVAEFYQ